MSFVEVIRPVFWVLISILFVSLSACGGGKVGSGETPNTSQGPFTVTVSTHFNNISAGGSSILTAVFVDAAGLKPADGTQVSWAVNDSALGSIAAFSTTTSGQASSTFTASKTAVGSVIITASVGSYSDAVSITINPDAASNASPNVVLILADDLGYGDLGSYGSVDAYTPNIDAIAAKGTRFTDFYAGGPKCSPSRYALMTGNDVNRDPNGAFYTAIGTEATGSGISESEYTMAEAFKDAGYQTAIIGKWHLGHGTMPKTLIEDLPTDLRFHPNNHGFNYFYGLLSGGIDYNSHWNRIDFYDWFQDLIGIKGENGLYSTHAIGQRAESYIKEAALAKKPFFLYLPFNAPHYGVPANAAETGLQLPLGEERKYLRQFDYLYPDDNDARKRYLAMVAVLDEEVGRIVATLEAEGLMGNTILMFASDNGGDNTHGGGNAPLAGQKASMWEGGIRVPAIMRWDGHIPKEKISGQLSHITDLFPTFLALTGNTSTRNFDGVDISSVLTADIAVDRPVAFAFPLFGNVYREGNWKYLVRAECPYKEELYNLANDLGETTNLAVSRPDILADLKQKHASWYSQFIYAPKGEMAGMRRCYLPPGAPTNVSIVASYRQITLSWNAVAGADLYNIYYSTSPDITSVNGKKLAGVTSPFVHTGLLSGTTYYYTVSAVKLGAGKSPDSNIVSAVSQ